MHWVNTYEIIGEFISCFRENYLNDCQSSITESVSSSETTENSIQMYPIGKLPLHDDKNILYDQLDGFRGFKIGLNKLFDNEIVGRLEPIINDLE